jgi:hypothetical protein
VGEKEEVEWEVGRQELEVGSRIWERGDGKL